MNLSNKMNKRYIENFSEEIVIGADNLKKQCALFLKSIEENTKKYKKDIQKDKKEFDKLKNNKNKVIFTPENLLNMSPITILDAPWGAGKTFFIESLCKYVLKDEIELDYIKKIIVIDSWKYSISNAIPTDFIFYLIENLANILKLTKEIKSRFIGFLNSVPLSILNKKIGTSLEIKNEQKKLSTDETINKLNKHIKDPILIIVDNIERIGENGWEILKTIQKLAMLDNLIFVLPMNKDRLVSEKLLNSEWKIEKYINIPFYSFKQDYIGILKKYNLSNELINIFNDLLSIQIDGECLSVRELDKILSKKNLEEEFKNKYIGLLHLRKIWPLDEEIKKIIYQDLEAFSYIVNDIDKDIVSFNELFKSQEYQNIKSEILNCVNLDIGSPEILANSYFWKNLTSKEIDWNLYSSYIERIEKIDFKEKIEEINNSIDKYDEEIKKNDNNIIDIEKRIIDLKSFILDYESNKIEKSSKNTEMYTLNKIELENQRKAYDSFSNENSNLKKEVDEAKSNILKIDNLKKLLSEFKEKCIFYITNMNDKYRENIKNNENNIVVFKTLIKNDDIWNDQNYDIDYIYEYFINEIINQ